MPKKNKNLKKYNSQKNKKMFKKHEKLIILIEKIKFKIKHKIKK